MISVETLSNEQELSETSSATKQKEFDEDLSESIFMTVSDATVDHFVGTILTNLSG